MGPINLRKIVQLAPSCGFPRNLRDPERRHNRQTRDQNEACASRQYRRSIFRLIYAYNLLPQKVVDAPMKLFQKYLQHALIRAANTNVLSWQVLFTSGIRNMIVEKLQSLFKAYDL